MTAEETISAAVSGDGCLGRSQLDEPVFVLVARDKLAADFVRAWAMAARDVGANAEKVADAVACADAMDKWREEHGGGKVPD